MELKPISKFGLQLLLCASLLLSLLCAVVFAGTWWSLAFTQCNGQRSAYYYIIQNRGWCYDESRGGLPHCTSWLDLSDDNSEPDNASNSAASYERTRQLSMTALVLSSSCFGAICVYCYMLYVRYVLPIVRILGILFSFLTVLLLISVLGVADGDNFFRDADSYPEKSACDESHSVPNVGYIMAICGIIVGSLVSGVLCFPVSVCMAPPVGERSAKGTILNVMADAAA